MPKQNRRFLFDVRLPGDLTQKFSDEFRAWVGNRAKENGFMNHYLASEVFSKYLDPSLVSAEDRGTAAVQKWLAAECRNSSTNVRLFTGDTDFGWVESESLIESIRRRIASILGPINYPSCLFEGQVTNGASTGIRRSPKAAIDKLTGRIELSESAIQHWLAFASGSHLSRLVIDVVDSSVLFTVPKKTEIDRVACKEPSGNMLLQRSLGEVIRRKLRKVGINLNDQTQNQRLAKDAVSCGLATIDLSSASDLISRQLVLNLLPFDWWSLLDDLRVKSTLLPDGTSHELEMFSSMGNGFTFELESLIFYSITQVVLSRSKIRGRVSVYGDDIICPSTIVPRLTRIMSYFGFIVNLKKTHSRGPFRESCGRHYWKGIDVTPFYLREAVRTLPQLINILNHLLEWDGRGWGFFTTEETYEFWRRWVKFIPTRLWGGICPSDPSALVTGHSPRQRIVPVTKALRSDELGRLTLWHHRREHSNEPVTIDPRVEVSFRTSRVIARGERTTWAPGMAWS